MKKKVLSIILALTMCLSLLPTMAWADGTHPATDHSGWTGVAELPTEEGNYYLTDNVTLEETWTVPAGTKESPNTVNLCLNGHVIKMTGTGSVINVPSGATLNLYDCSEYNAAHLFNVDANGLWKYSKKYTSEELADGVEYGENERLVYGGVITGGNAENGGCVNVSGGTFNMYSGSIVGNTATNGVVYVNESGVFTMIGGMITGNTAQNGGGVCVTGTLNMHGGEITDNAATNGGGVYINETGKFYEDDGMIYYNAATENGGGVYDGGTVTLGGDAWIMANYAADGETASNLYLSSGKTVAFGNGTTVAVPDTDLFGLTIGVTTMVAPTSSAPVVIAESGVTIDIAKCFTSDVGYSVVRSGDKLQFEYSYPVKIGSTQVTPDNANDVLGDGKISYDPATQTLTLDNAKIATEGTSFCSSAIRSELPDDLTINLIGDNRIGAVPADAANKSDYNVWFGIAATDNNVTITGDGNLTIYSWMDGIWADNVDLSPDFTGTLTIRNYGETNYVTAGGPYISDMPAIRAYSNVGIRGGTVNITCHDGGGIYADEGNIVIEGGATVNVTSDKFSGIKAAPGTMDTDEGIGSYYAGGGDVRIYNGAKVTVNAGTKADKLVTDVYGIYAAGKVEIGMEDEKASEVSVTVGNTNISGDFDIDGIKSENGNTTIIGSKVSVQSVKGRGIGIGVCGGPECGCISILDSTVDVEAGDSGIVAFEWDFDCDVTITNSTVTVKAEDWGINALNDVTITDSTVTVESDTWGIECDTLTVEGAQTQVKSTGDETGLAVYGGENALTVKSGSLKLVGGEMAFDAGENAAFTTSLPTGYALKGSRLENVFTDLQSITLKKYSGEDEFYEGHTVSYVGNARAKSVMLAAKDSESGGSSTVTVPVAGDENSVKVQATVSGSTATVKEIKDADLAKVADAETVEIDLSGLNKNIDTAKIPTTTVEKIGEQAGMSVKLSTATVTFDQTATQEISDQAKGSTVELVVDDVKEVSLNAVQKEAVGKLDVSLIIDAHLVSNGTRLCSESNGGFGGGKATVALPYEIKNNRTAANYSIFYVDDAGKLEKLNAKYDTKLGAFVFDITHFSNYVVAYDENACLKDATCVYAKFTDADTKAWYHDGVHFCVENGYMQGVSTDKFAPSSTITRGMIVTMLWRMEGEPVVNYAMSFKDVKNGKWYTEAVRWAAAEKIVSGYDAEHFGANDPVTREQLATILYRYAQSKGEGFTGDWMFLLDFVDRASVKSWANEAVHWCSMKRIVAGKAENGSKVFDPQGYASRAEAAAMLQRYCELTEE